MEQYFQKFPVIKYNNTLTRNITERVSLTLDYHSPNSYYPYELKYGMRSDVVANAYYNDSYLDWLIYLTNGITDPYYDWYLDPEQFNKYLIKKYGGIEDAQEKILFYRNNWADDTINVSPTVYSNLPEQIKKYYIPNFGVGAEIQFYSRRQEDWQVNTNQTFTFTSSGIFEVDDVVEFVDGDVVGYGICCNVSDSQYTLQHMFGEVPTVAMTVQKKNTTTTYAITEIISHVYNIDLDEQYFWSPVYAYDYEMEQNESKKFIYLLDARFAMETTESIRQKLLKNE